MARSQRKFRSKFNESLDWLESGGNILSISEFSRVLDTSRTTSRVILERLTSLGLIEHNRGKLIRPISSADYYPQNDVLETREILRTACMRWIMKERFRPGARLDEVLIATKLQIPVSSVHDFFVSLNQFGFISHSKNRLWTVEPIDYEFISQILELRIILELKSINRLVKLPNNHVFWGKLKNLRKEHVKQIKADKGDSIPFFELDNRLHTLMNSASDNRLMKTFEEAVFFIFFYHYQWEKVSEKNRNLNALKEHLNFIDALLERNDYKAKRYLFIHLQSAQNTLMNSIEQRQKTPPSAPDTMDSRLLQDE